MLSITLFGSLAVSLDNKSLSGFPTDTTRALLAYLVVHAGQPQPRTTLATLLWPNLSQEAGLQNVRTTLYRLRNVLDDKNREVPFILGDRRAIQFNVNSAYVLDASRFDALYQEIQRNKVWQPEERTLHMETAVALYQPHYIPELVANSNEFEAWREAQEQRHQRQAYWLLDQLVATAMTHSDFPAMSRYARQQIDLDPFNETGHQNQMRALASMGQRQQAIAHYHTFCQSLGGEPSSTLVAFYSQLDTGNVSIPISNPYRGLDAFHEEDAPDFYGRETIVTQLIEMLHERPFVALIGPSGSGKTSVACAGICPQLRRAGWHILRLRPGIQPWQTLAEAITTQIPHIPIPTPETLVDGRYTSADLKQAIRATSKEGRPFHLLVIIDQFEQLYTLLPDETQRTAFIDWLLRAGKETGIHLLLTLRADFMGQALAHRPLADALQPGILPIGPMTRRELRRAIIYPATNRHVTFQDGLIKRILDDVVAAPGQLPLLQFTLTCLWEAREENWMTHRAYETNDGVAGALSHHAQTIYNRLNATEQQFARRIFLRLVQPGHGTADTSRPTARNELPKTAWPLVQRLADARLIVTSHNKSGQETAALAHETLITNWPRLRDWLDEDHAFHTWQQRLDTTRAQWQQSNRDAGALLRGWLLSEAEGWHSARAADLSPASLAYIEASLQARDARQKAKEAQRQQELAQAQALAEVESQRAAIAAQARQRLYRLTIGLAIFLVVSALATIAAVQQWHQAQEAAAVAQSLNLATSAQLALSEGQTNLALTLAVGANQQPEPPPQAQLMLAETAYAPGARRIFSGHDGPVEDVALVPDSWAQALSASADGTLILWDLASGESLRRFHGHDGAVHGVAFLPQGEQALSASADGTLILWDVASGDIMNRFMGHEGDVWDVAVRPGCDLAQADCQAISAGEDGSLILWDVAAGSVIRRFGGHAGPVYALAISPDGRTALSGSADSSLILWDIESGSMIHHLQGLRTAESTAADNEEAPHTEGHRGPVRDVIFAPDGRTAYSVADDLRTIYWDLEAGLPLRADAFNAGLYSVALSPDGRYVLLGRSDSQLILWSPYYGQPLLALLGHTSRIQAVAFSPDGHQAISGSADGTMRLWDLRSGAEMRSMIVNGSALDVALSSNGKMILLAGASGDLHLWDYDSGTEIRRLVGHTETPFAGALFRPSTGDSSPPLMAVSGGGDVFGVAEDNTLRLWNVETGQEIRRFEGHTDRLWDFDVSGDGRFAISASHDGTVCLWNLDDGTSNVLADFSPQVPRSIVFSPDGHTILVGMAKGVSDTPDFSLRLLDAQTGALLHTFSGHTEIVSDVAFSADGRTALSGSHDKLLILWDVATGQELQRFIGHTGAVNQVRFSPTIDGNGRQFALSAGLDNLIILWDVETGQPLRIYRGHVGGVMSIAFAPNGSSFFSVALDDSVREWRIDATLPDLQAWVTANRTVVPLTCEQAIQFGMMNACNEE
ncbi:MAG: winged helix-turn-helix domain-containing protein [Anaerolineales bacterium]|nr:winged helix-turn-helix domain-containing protein [Anaerolineales bacterium]